MVYVTARKNYNSVSPVPPLTPSTAMSLVVRFHNFVSFRETVEVANVGYIQEKIVYLAGNKRSMCVVRAPNLLERE